ncbi:hypothetical protein [Nonomuraea sp. NPDC049480]|uniref:hypothetical protein n=1 Tax=Nonomuraea sp. NPDC049480 TaxID=3364353 RepID=UPI0037BB4E3C
MRALPGFHREARWLRHVRAHYREMFPFIPRDFGYDKRLRAALPQIKRVVPGAGDGHALLARHRVDDRLDPGAVRDVPPDEAKGVLESDP